MAGIVATSATTNNSGSTTPDASVSGYLTNEEITLTASPAGSSYSWSLSVPSGSSRATLTSTTDADPRFTPDVDGFYVVSLNVDGTEYVLRAAIVSTGVVATLGNTRYLPLLNSQAPAPSSGITVFYSSDEGAFSFKTTAGAVGSFLVDTATFYDLIPQDPAPAHLRGRIFYDGVDETLAVYNDNSAVTHQLGQELHVRVVNNTGAQIDDQSVVYVSGAQGNRPTIALADASSVSTSHVLGVATHNIADNAEGVVTFVGTVDFDTSGFGDGDTLYLSTTAGQLTTTKPTGTSAVREVGFALNSTLNGKILVTVNSSDCVADSCDVNDGTPTAGNYLSGDGTHWTTASLATDVSALPLQSRTVAGTGDTLLLTDVGKVIDCTSASAVTVTVPPNSSVAYDIGSVIYVSQQGAGQVTIAPGVGVTLNAPSSGGLKTDEQYAAPVAIRKTATDTWNVVGGVA